MLDFVWTEASRDAVFGFFLFFSALAQFSQMFLACEYSSPVAGFQKSNTRCRDPVEAHHVYLASVEPCSLPLTAAFWFFKWRSPVAFLQLSDTQCSFAGGGRSALWRCRIQHLWMGISITDSLVVLGTLSTSNTHLNAIDKIKGNWFIKVMFSLANRAGVPTLLAF